ncbi:MAG: Ni-sirohydrochlorin a,c-diamide synthase [Halobacteriota archaeon]
MAKQRTSKPRVLIAADRSSAGKTTIAVGLMSLLRREGHTVQPFKVGLDYIDPSYHSEVTGRFSRNLDGFLMDQRAIIEVFSHASNDADLCVIEGVRGLYEGLESLSDCGSTAQVAKILNTPVILVVDARSITRSTAALVKGYKSFDPGVDIRGVILNKIGSASHAKKAKEAIEHYTGVDVVGQIPRNDAMRLAMRHLGLVPAVEGITRSGHFKPQLKLIENVIKDSVDLDKVVEIASSASTLPTLPPVLFKPEDKRQNRRKRVRIGVAYDEAFNFYYHDLFDLFALNNVDVAFFSPLRDSVLPDVSGIYIGGGYPELFAKELTRNRSIRAAIAARAAEGMPIFAECGGLMYLTESLTYKGERSRMVGAIPASAAMVDKRVIGYVTGQTVRDTILGPRGIRFRGHEFHYSDVTGLDDTLQFAFKLKKGIGIADGYDGIHLRGTLASYAHVHPLSFPRLTTHLAHSCEDFRDQTPRSTLSL